MNASNWTLWLLLAMTYCALTYNPVYQTLLLLAVATCAIRQRLPLMSYVKAGLLMSAIPLFINVFFVHLGKTVLATVPPKVLGVPTLVLSGNITAEALAFAAIMTVFLVNMLVSFQVFNGSTTPDAVLRMIPASVPAVALTASIGMRFVPTVLKDFYSIRDAQVSRGVRMNSLSSRASLIAPTVVTSLERGFNLAESMASRGYSERGRFT